MNQFETPPSPEQEGSISKEEWKRQRDAEVAEFERQKIETNKFIQGLEGKNKDELLSLRDELQGEWDKNLANPAKGAMNPISDRRNAVERKLSELGVGD